MWQMQPEKNDSGRLKTLAWRKIIQKFDPEHQGWRLTRYKANTIWQGTR